MVITMPIAAFFGFLIGKLMNKMKGQEMIGGLILGYFANGLYQLLFLFIFGNLIPLKTPGLVIKGSTGVANTIDLSTERGFKYALDGLWRVPFGTAALILCGLIAIWSLVKLATKKEDKKKALTRTGICVAVAVIAQLPFVTAAFSMVSVPMVTFLIVALLCVFNNAIMKTRIGQQFRAVGQNRTVANAAGINVDRVRVIAIIISTVLAGWGQLIFVQNMGSFQTYGAHEQVGLYAGAGNPGRRELLSRKQPTDRRFSAVSCSTSYSLWHRPQVKICLVMQLSVSISVYSFPTALLRWPWLCTRGR